MKTTRRALLAICAALVIGCAGSPSRTAEVPAVPGALPPGPAQAAAATGYDHPAWQQLIAAARNEGKLIMRGAPNPEAREDIPRAFKERFGVEIEWDSARASDLYSRLESERVSGLYSMDVVISGNDLALMLQKGWLEPLRPLLVVPEVSDPSAWRNNRLPFVDPEQQFMFQLERAVYGSWAINPQAVDESELRTLDDVLNPKWKGKLSVDDPTVAGLGELNAVYLYLEKGDDFFKRLYVDQAPVVSRDDRQKEDWLARGAYPISYGLAPKNVSQMTRQGLPVKDLGTLDGKGWVRGPMMVMLNNAPHPNAAKLFVNWITSPEGLQLHAMAERLPPTRKDVEHAWMEEYQVPKEHSLYLDVDDFAFTVEEKPKIITRIREILGR